MKEAIAFWDFENITVPEDMSSSDIIYKLKDLMKTQGISLQECNISFIGNNNNMKRKMIKELKNINAISFNTFNLKQGSVDKIIINRLYNFIQINLSPINIIFISNNIEFSKVLLDINIIYNLILIHDFTLLPIFTNLPNKNITWLFN
jgi:hypothetical protein